MANLPIHIVKRVIKRHGRQTHDVRTTYVTHHPSLLQLLPSPDMSMIEKTRLIHSETGERTGRGTSKNYLEGLVNVSLEED
jgi:hypothetical protein